MNTRLRLRLTLLALVLVLIRRPFDFIIKVKLARPFKSLPEHFTTFYVSETV